MQPAALAKMTGATIPNAVAVVPAVADATRQVNPDIPKGKLENIM